MEHRASVDLANMMNCKTAFVAFGYSAVLWTKFMLACIDVCMFLL